ncbi:MAG: acyl-CoA dehydrogenase [Caulobacter sp.]|nr:acyl-CoA dehydrogenase [Caulobacter sp.]
MEFAWTPEHRAFRQRLRDVLAANLPDNWPVVSNGYDNGSDASVAFSRKFCPILAEEGLLIPHWPKENGGGGLDAFHHWILGEEMWGVGEPRAYQYMSINWVGPAIIKFGTPEQQAEHLPRICGGTISYCQGFSEPGAGSDLAALRTRAEPTGDGRYIVNGQKIWTSAASFADACILLARTGAERHAGISMFIVPMDLPGITVRVIPGMQGERAMHEVFFDDVEVGPECLLGTENGGWKVATEVLANERIGVPRYALTWRGFNKALEHLRLDGRLENAAIRARAARCEAALKAARLAALGVINARIHHRPADVSVNVARYAAVWADRQVVEFLGDFAGDLLFYDVDAVVTAAYKRATSIGIGAGAAEVQLNLVSRNLLQMPRGNA